MRAHLTLFFTRIHFNRTTIHHNPQVRGTPPGSQTSFRSADTTCRMAFRHVVSGQDAKIRLKDLLFDASELQYPENPPVGAFQLSHTSSTCHAHHRPQVSVFQFDGGEDHKISEKLKVISEEFMTLYIRVGKQGGKIYLVGFRPEKAVEWTGGVIKAAGTPYYASHP